MLVIDVSNMELIGGTAYPRTPFGYLGHILVSHLQKPVYLSNSMIVTST